MYFIFLILHGYHRIVQCERGIRNFFGEPSEHFRCLHPVGLVASQPISDQYTYMRRKTTSVTVNIATSFPVVLFLVPKTCWRLLMQYCAMRALSPLI